MIIGLREEVEDEEEEEEDRDEDDAEEDDDETVVEAEGKLVEIEIDLEATAWGNAQEYFNQKKVAAEKVFTRPSTKIPRLILVGISNSTIFIQCLEKRRTQNHSRLAKEPERRKAIDEKYSRNKMV